MKNIWVLIIVVSISILFTSCSDDDNPTAPSSAGTYTGTTSTSNEALIKISGVNGSAYVTSYSLTITTFSGGGTITETFGETDSEGLAKVQNSSFTISLSEDINNKITGMIDGDEITGTYSIYDGEVDGVAVYLTGTYTVTKN